MSSGSEAESRVNALLKQLYHHDINHTGDDPFLNVPDANKVAWRNVPKEDLSIVDPPNDIELAKEGAAAAVDSDVDSGGDSDLECLQSAGVWSDVETIKIHLSHLSKLKAAYLNEFDYIRYRLRESRRKYLQAVAVEKQTLPSIHSMPKTTEEDREEYRQLKAMLNYHRHNGKQAILRHALREKRASASATESSVISRDRSAGRQTGKRCCYSQGSWKCDEQPVPMAKHCLKHILEDPYQVLYRSCGVQNGGGEPCHTPIIPLPHISTCVYHTPVPTPSFKNFKATNPSGNNSALKSLEDSTEKAAGEQFISDVLKATDSSLRFQSPEVMEIDKQETVDVTPIEAQFVLKK